MLFTSKFHIAHPKQEVKYCSNYHEFTKNSELRTQNYLFDLIHLHFCYYNTIQYNTVQFMGLFIFVLVNLQLKCVFNRNQRFLLFFLWVPNVFESRNHVRYLSSSQIQINHFLLMDFKLLKPTKCPDTPALILKFVRNCLSLLIKSMLYPIFSQT